MTSEVSSVATMSCQVFSYMKIPDMSGRAVIAQCMCQQFPDSNDIVSVVLVNINAFQHPMQCILLARY